ASPYTRRVLADHPLAYWPLNDEPGSQTIEDYSPNKFHGQAVGDVTLGQPGFSANTTSAEFDTKGRIDIGTYEQFCLTGNFTLEAWVRIDSMTELGGWFFSGYTWGKNRGWGLGFNPPDHENSTGLFKGVRG